MNRTALLVAAAAITVAGPAFAGSVATDAFVANVRPNVDFLDRSSRLALDKSSSPAVRSFAHREAMQQTIAANSLVAWTQTNTIRGQDVALGRPVVGTVVTPVGEVVAAPVDVAVGVTNGVAAGVDDIVTGRSVAIDRPLTVTRAPDAPTLGGTLLPAGAEDLSRLDGLSGHAFDALYRSTQLDSLRQLSTLYRDYAANGDDPALRALATRELPKVNARIVELRRF